MCQDILTEEFMERNGIEPHEGILAMSDEFFIPKLNGYKGPVTKYSKFYYFIIQNKSRYK